MFSMLKASWRLLTRLFTSWWTRVGLASGLLSFVGRLVDTAVLTPYVRIAFTWITGVCILYALVSTFSEQDKEIQRLATLIGEHNDLTIAVSQKLRGEVQSNLNNLDTGDWLHDQSFISLSPEHLNLFRYHIRSLLIEFYNDLRVLKPLLTNSDPRQVTMRRIIDSKNKMRTVGNQLLAALISPEMIR